MFDISYNLISFRIHVTRHFIHYRILLRLGLLDPGIGLRIDNARRTVLARVTGLVFSRCFYRGHASLEAALSVGRSVRR